jgi:hypothetical protein
MILDKELFVKDKLSTETIILNNENDSSENEIAETGRDEEERSYF